MFDVCMQMLKVYALARVTPTALRQLLTSMNISCATAPTQPPTEAPPGSTSGVSKQARTSTGSTAAAGVLAAAVQPSGSSTAAAAGGSSSGAVVVEAGSVPPDEVLSGSNIYSTAEACLLTWINAHAIKAFPKLVDSSRWLFGWVMACVSLVPRQPKACYTKDSGSKDSN